jgi:hypothetical protein
VFARVPNLLEDWFDRLAEQRTDPAPARDGEMRIG